MKNATLKRAREYGIFQSDLEEFARTYGYTPVEIKKVRGYAKFGIPDSDYLIAVDEFGLEVTVEINFGKCPECNEKCVAFGWGDGGYHSSTCKCGDIDFS